MYTVSSARSCKMLTIKIVNNALLVFILRVLLIKHLIFPNYSTVSYLKTGA